MKVEETVKCMAEAHEQKSSVMTLIISMTLEKIITETEKSHQFYSKVCIRKRSLVLRTENQKKERRSRNTKHPFKQPHSAKTEFIPCEDRTSLHRYLQQHQWQDQRRHICKDK